MDDASVIALFGIVTTGAVGIVAQVLGYRREAAARRHAERLQKEGAHRLGTNSEDFTDDERDELERLLRDYQKERLISYPPYESGIKFVVQVHVPDRRTQQSRALGDALENTLCAVLDEAYGVIWDRSLYRSRSGHIQFIFLGRVRLRPDVDDEGNEKHPFHEIAPRLLDRVSQAATLSGRRTYTFFLPLESFIEYRDELSLPPAPQPLEPDALELFCKREGHYFEAKGSAWTDLDGWLKEEIDEIPAGNRQESRDWVLGSETWAGPGPGAAATSRFSMRKSC